MIELMISENEVGQGMDLNRAVVGDEDDEDKEEFSIEAKIRAQMRSSQSTQATHSLFESVISPMQLEMNRYLNQQDLPPANVDVLQWWRNHHREYPLLAKCARKYLCIQASSASSERVFSTGGAIVTYKRTKLDVENVHMLVYCKENLARVKISTKVYEDEEEEEAEEELDLEDKTTEVLAEGSAKIHVGKGKGTGKRTKLAVSPGISQTRSSTPASNSSSGSSTYVQTID